MAINMSWGQGGEIAFYIPGLGILIRPFKLYNLVTAVSPCSTREDFHSPYKERCEGLSLSHVEILSTAIVCCFPVRAETLLR